MGLIWASECPGRPNVTLHLSCISVLLASQNLSPNLGIKALGPRRLSRINSQDICGFLAALCLPMHCVRLRAHADMQHFSQHRLLLRLPLAGEPLGAAPPQQAAAVLVYRPFGSARSLFFFFFCIHVTLKSGTHVNT